MSDASSPNAAAAVPHSPFPAVRLFYAIAYAVVAWFVFWVLLALGVVQFVVFAVNGRINAELKTLTANLAQYLWELLAFICFLRDERPFPIGTFPNGNSAKN
jgi:hypothetical protein